SFSSSITSISLLFSFSSYRPHPDLHSFPTRRSSDLTCTYDHRVIQGAESGSFLGRLEDLLQGKDGFYDEIFEHLRVPHLPVRKSDRKSTRLNSSHVAISYAVFCLKKKKKNKNKTVQI